jgi:hypothetical protein
MTLQLSVSIQNKLPKSYRRKATNILMGLDSGVPYYYFHGKRFRGHRNIIGIPLGKHYRILCLDIHGEIIPKKILTHAEYDRFG